MPKSQIIKDIASGNTDVTISLKRLKVLMSSFSKPEILDWINAELNGYQVEKDIPDYRKQKGMVKGTYYLGTIQYSKAPIPLSVLTKEQRDLFEKVTIGQSVGSLVYGINDKTDGNFCKPIPDTFYAILMLSSNIDSILFAYTEITKTNVINIVTTIDNIILDILLLLEREFGPLDDLDININSKEQEETTIIEKKVIQIIYNDYSTSIGDYNKFKDTEINTK